MHSDMVEVAADRPDELPPGAAAWQQDRVLVAPFAAPRFTDPATWEPEVRRYLELAGANP